ncbi:MAG: hypothetical protein EAY75_09025 [Bacteroidetes bacterium]|nr:MAG: hypothetical protein EAY75_09025 [Bacteroidota bacterium]
MLYSQQQPLDTRAALVIVASIKPCFFFELVLPYTKNFNVEFLVMILSIYLPILGYLRGPGSTRKAAVSCLLALKTT